MGTRNLTIVYIDGEYRVAQYGQWDGYPEGQGATCLEFCKRLSDVGFRAEFERKIRACRWITQQEADAINARVESGELKDWQSVYPELSRDTCAGILQLIMDSEDEIKLRNALPFIAACDCEYAWVIDLDNNTFEGYIGFNKTPLSSDERFFFMEECVPKYERERGYHPAKFVAKWSLDDLPTKDEMCAAFVVEDDEDEEEPTPLF
jgi:hypothetical protein